jgi:predicted RNA binding protein YcfA (HicA-like mRNA interferase family)
MSGDGGFPQVSGPEAIRVFEKLGFTVKRIKGSHHVMKRERTVHLLVVPCHGAKPLKKGLLYSLLKIANLTRSEFIDLL